MPHVIQQLVLDVLLASHDIIHACGLGILLVFIVIFIVSLRTSLRLFIGLSSCSPASVRGPPRLSHNRLEVLQSNNLVFDVRVKSLLS